jgi:hypothetical protein
MTPEQAKLEFERVRIETGGFPWLAQFNYQGTLLGGDAVYEKDPRVSDFLKWMPPEKLSHILELASCEGGQSLGICKHPNVKTLHGLDGKPWLVERAKFIASLFNLPATYGVCNFDDYHYLDELSRAKASVVFCSGVLYHLINPVLFLRSLTNISDYMYLATHYKNGTPTCDCEGYGTFKVGEIPGETSWSGIARQVLWFNLPELIRCLNDLGWNIETMRTWQQWDPPRDSHAMLSALLKRK